MVLCYLSTPNNSREKKKVNSKYWLLTHLSSSAGRGVEKQLNVAVLCGEDKGQTNMRSCNWNNKNAITIKGSIDTPKAYQFLYYIGWTLL